MHSNSFLDLSRHKILDIESVEFKANEVATILTVVHFNRITTAPYWFSYEDFKKVTNKGYI